jgi:predicted TIM-barrel fold metal-dependent hydrolase
MEELNRRKAVVFVHPSALPGPRVPDLPPAAADFPLDTSRAALKLARSGTMYRYPDLKIILSLGGGFVPSAAMRMARVAGSGDVEDGLRILRKFYFDTALTSSPYGMPSLLAFADPTHITFGSDWPYASADVGAMFAEMLDDFGDVDHDAINRNNAEQLFPPLATQPTPRTGPPGPLTITPCPCTRDCSELRRTELRRA